MSIIDQLRRSIDPDGSYDDDMSLITAEDRATANPASPHGPADDDAEPTRAESGLAWAVAPAAAVAFGLAVVRADAGRAALSAALAAAVTALTLTRTRRADHSDRLHLGDWRSMLALGTVGGVLAGVGNLAIATGHGVSRSAATLVVGWLALACAIVQQGVEADGSPASLRTTTERTTRFVEHTVLAIAALAVVSLVTRSFERSASEMLLAAPVGLALYVVAGILSPSGPSELRRSVRAIACGAAAAVLAGAALGSTQASTPLLAGLLVVTVLGLVLVRIGHQHSADRSFVSRRTWLGGGAVAAVAAGFAASPLALLGLSALVIHEARQRLAFADPVVVPTVQPERSKRSATAIVGGLATVGLTLRLLAFRGLWLDEATSVHQARLPFTDMIRLIYSQDNHPPLSQSLLWVTIRTVGDSEFAVRLPEVLLGTLLIPMLYITGRELFDRRVGLFAAAIGTVAPLAVWYGQEARMYAQFMLLALIMVWAQARILKGSSARYWILFTAASVLLVYTQYFSILHVGATLFIFALAILQRYRHRHDASVETALRSLIKPFLISVGTQIVLIAPLIPFALHQAVHNQETGNGFSSAAISAGSAVVPAPGIYGLLTNIQWAIWGYQPTVLTTRLVALWPVGLLILLLLLGQPRRNANRSLLIIAGLPIMAIFGASFVASKNRSLAEVRYVAGAVPILFLLLAAGIATVVTSRRIQNVVMGALLVSMLAALFVQETSTDNPRLYQYREAVRQVQEQASPGDQLIYAPHYMDYVLEYYNPGISVAPLENGLPTHPLGKVFLLEAASFSDSNDAGSDVAAAIHTLEGEGMKLRARYDYAQISVWELS